MARKDKHGSRGHFIKLDNWVFEHATYRALSLGARALHMEIIRVYNGHNNGSLYLSHRIAASRLGCCRNTVAKFYNELESAGFILKTRDHCLGAVGRGEAKHWELTHLSMPGSKPKLLFKKQNPRTKTGQSMAQRVSR